MNQLLVTVIDSLSLTVAELSQGYGDSSVRYFPDTVLAAKVVCCILMFQAKPCTCHQTAPVMKVTMIIN